LQVSGFSHVPTRKALPFHAAKILHPRKSIMRDADLTVEDLEKLL
jgi:hypothetical protein